MENAERKEVQAVFEPLYSGPGEKSGYGITGSVFLNGEVATKVYCADFPKSEVFKEAYMLAFLEESGIETSRALRVAQEHGHWVLQMSRVHGESMLDAMFRALLSGDIDGAVAGIERMAEIQAQVNKTPAAGLPTFKNYAASVIGKNPALSPYQRECLLAQLRELPDGLFVCHGDIHPNNILCPTPDKWTIIDWPEMTCGDPCADGCRSYVNLCRFADCTGFIQHAPNSSELYQNLGDAFFRKLESLDLMRVFLDRYCVLMGCTHEDVLRWLPIQAGMLYGYKEEDICDFLRPYLPPETAPVA